MTNLKVGDYVLATKYSYGDPNDPWAIGFYSGTLPKPSGDRYLLVDGDGRKMRSNGFRRMKKISLERGRWLLRHAGEIELSGRSVWGWLRRPMKEKV